MDIKTKEMHLLAVGEQSINSRMDEGYTKNMGWKITKEYFENSLELTNEIVTFLRGTDSGTIMISATSEEIEKMPEFKKLYDL